MRLFFSVGVVAAVLGGPCAHAQAEAQPPVWGLKVTGLAAAPVADGNESSARATFEPSLKWKSPTTELRGRVRMRWLKLDGDERRDTDIRELTAAWRSSGTTLTLGAQQVNWGRMDILRVTDVINPVDQHDLFHEELPEAKLALWMANLEWQSGSQTLQIIATPQVPVDRLAHEWGGLPLDVAEPRSSLRNSTLALRYGFEALGWNADVIASRGWQPTPTPRPVMDTGGLRLHGVVSRQNSVGFSADKPVGGAVLRLEGLVARLKPHDAPAALAVGDRRQASLGAGLDVRAGDWFFAGQVIAQSERDTLAGRSRNTYASLIVQRKWMQDRLAARALHIRETRGSSSWTSLQASYELSPNQLLQVQADRFRGDPAQPFGSFSGRSRVAASMRLTF
jgi:hypothetical protein